MDTEFHYWITAIIAERAGFTQSEATVIATCAEYVDENDCAIKVTWPDKRKNFYRNFISQTMNIFLPDRKLLRIYPLFHFVPGDPEAESARRVDGHMHILNTTPDSENARYLFDAAFTAPEHLRLYRIGIASHMYVDTWAHQNFVGWEDSHNQIGLDLKFNIGHADAEHHPDWVAHRWQDSRLLESDVDNRLRFLAAAEALFRRYCRYLKEQGRGDNIDGWEGLQRDLDEAMGRYYTGSDNWYAEERHTAYRRLAPWLGAFDEREWFDAAIDTEVHGMRDANTGLRALLTLFPDSYTFRDDVDIEQCHWYCFQEAVKDHERLGLDLLEPLFKQMQIDIRRR